MNYDSTTDRYKQKALSLLDQKQFKKLRTYLKKFPKKLSQEAAEFELQILAEENTPQELSKAFDKYLAKYENIRLSNLEVALRVKVDLAEYDDVLAIAERIFSVDPHNHTAVSGVFVVYVNRKQRQQAYDTATTMLHIWDVLQKNEEHLVDAKLKIVLTAVQISKFHEAAKYWEEVEQQIETYPHLFGSEHFACAIRAFSNLGRNNDAIRIVENLPPEFATSENIISSLPVVWFNAGDKNKCDAAYKAMEESTIDPVETIWNRSLARLGFGDIDDGLEDYEIRWKWDEFPSAKRVFSSPLWMGEDLSDKRILVWGEQGIGDQLLFLTLLPVVLSKNPREVVVEVSKKIIPLVQRWYPEVTVGSDGVVDTIGNEFYDQFDLNIPAGTLMQRHVAEYGENFKCRRLLRVPEAGKEKLLPSNIAQKRIIIGVSWRSHLITDARVGNYMNVQSVLKMMESLPEDVGVVSLQYSLLQEERELLEENPNIFVPDHDFFEQVDINALYAGCCDLVVTAGTVTLQLAGIYGVPVLTWLPNRDWVLLGRDHYPWFENVVVVRGDPDWDNTSMLNAMINKLKIILRLV